MAWPLDHWSCSFLMTWWQKARKLGCFHPDFHCERRMVSSSSPFLTASHVFVPLPIPIPKA